MTTTYSRADGTTGPATALGEGIRIGDIIQQELGNYESRKICRLKASQGVSTNSAGIKKGQILGGDPFASDVKLAQLTAAGDLSILGANEVQTVSIGAASGSGFGAGTYVLKFTDYLGIKRQTVEMAYNDNASTVAGFINATGCLGASAVTVASVTAAGASTPLVFTITFDGTNYAGKSQPLVEVDVTADLTDGSAEVNAYVSRTTSVEATCIALEDKAYVAGVQNILCLVRQAMVKPLYLNYGTNRTTTALKSINNMQLQKNAGIVVLGGPDYGQNPDVTDVSRDTAGSYDSPATTIPTGIPGL